MNITTLDGGERYVIFIFFSIYFMVVNGFTELTIAVSSSSFLPTLEPNSRCKMWLDLGAFAGSQSYPFFVSRDLKLCAMNIRGFFARAAE